MRELGTSEASRVYDVHAVHLLRLIAMGRLDAHKDPDGHWLIRKESLDRWNRNRIRRKPANLQNRVQTQQIPVMTGTL